MDLRSGLAGCSSSQLARMAAAWKLSVEAGTLRRELLEQLAPRIAAGAADPSTWSGLGRVERRVLERLALAGGRQEADLLIRRVGREASAEGSVGEAVEVETAIAGLVERGLLFRVFDADEQRRGVYLILPDELLNTARQHGVNGARGSPLTPADSPVRIARVNVAVDLFVLASAFRREAWGAASRDLAGRTARSVGQVIVLLQRQSPDGPGAPGRRWRFLLWLAQRAGWIRRGSWPTPDEDLIERLLTEPGALPSLALAAGPVTSQASGTERAGRVDARRRQSDALQFLSELRAECWWSSTDVTAWLADELIGPEDGSSDARRMRERRQLENQLGRWLTGRWFWLGLVDWGWHEDGWALVAPTNALRLWATGRESGGQPAASPGKVTGRFQFEVTLDGDLATLYRAERYLALTGSNPARRRYSLTPASFDRGVRIGGERVELLTLLGRLLDSPVPETWRMAIDTWASGASRLRLGARLLLTSDRAEALDEALEVPGVGVAVTESLTPNHVQVDGERVADLLAELARAGLPVEIDPGLRVEPRDAGRSAALANGVAETAWVALEVLRRLAPEVVAEQRDLQTARSRLDAVLAASVLDALDRRAASIVAAIANRRRPGARRRVV